MKILLVAPYRLEGAGGVSTVVYRLRDALERHGHRTLVLVAGDTDTVSPVPREGGGAFGIYLRSAVLRRAPLRSALAFCAYLPTTLWSLARFLRREDIDVVHLHFPTPVSLYVAVLRAFARWKLVVTVHGTDVYALPRRSRLHRFLLGRVLARADAIAAASRDLLRAHDAAFPRLRPARHVIRNGNPLTEASPRPAATMPDDLPARYAIAVGSLIPRKGYDVLLRAVRVARDRGHDIHLVIVGGGPDGGALNLLAKDLGVDDLVRLAGEVSHDAVMGFYERASFFVHAAREEAFGLVLLEAMSAGKAVVATRVNGIPEFVQDGETGLLVAPEDPEAMAAALIRIEGDGELRDRLAARGRDFATRECTWDAFTRQYIELYESVGHGPRGAHA